MSHRPVIGVLGLIGALGLIAGIGLPGEATAAAATVTCPTVNQTTGAVTPAPSPGVNWSGCDLDNAIMSGADLAGANLSGASITGESRQEELVGANLSGANLSSAVMAGADMTGANLTNADLTDTSLFDAVLGGTDLSGATLTGANMGNLESGSGHITGTPAALPPNWVIDGGFLIGPTAYLVESDLAGINLSGADLASGTLDSANLTGCDLTGANLSSAGVQDADLADANLTSADATGAALNSAELTGATLSGTQLSGASLSDVVSGGVTGTAASLPANWSQAAGYLIGPSDSLTNADLAGASLTTADLVLSNLTGADLAGADLSSANLTSAVLTGTNLSGADMASATLKLVLSGGVTGTAPSLPANWSVLAGYLIGPGTSLLNADLSGANLSGVDLTDSLLEDANLTGANLSGANLSEVNANRANLTDANLSAANLTGSLMGATNVSGADMGTATLTGVRSAELTGTPASLPSGWSVLAGYLVGPGAGLNGANLANQNLSGANLTGTNLESANLTGTNLSGANLSGANLNFATLDDADLQGANVTGATFTNALWDNTTCPDGSNSNAHDDGCFSPLDATGPTASPVVTVGTAGANGWYTSAVTVAWNWTDPGTIVSADCQQTSTTSGNGTFTLQATCEDLAGNIGHAADTVKVDGTRPAVSVTGVGNGARYVLGKVPAAGCRTSEAVSGVATNARLKLTTTGANGVGRFTATCSGAVSVAGTGQAGAVTTSYTVVYGFSGFSGLRSGEVIAKSARTITARFRITRAGGKDILAAPTAAFVARHGLEVRLTGPGIKAVTAQCRWVGSARSIECTITIPPGVRLGTANRYKITAEENVGTGFVVAPAVARAVNPLVVTFTSR